MYRLPLPNQGKGSLVAIPSSIVDPYYAHMQTIMEAQEGILTCACTMLPT